jgi:DNA-binding transcriptional ArsR family regulator
MTSGSSESILWYLLAGTRGGANRLRILALLRERPYNAHVLSELTGLDYRTVRHHLELMVEHRLVACPRPDAYATLYFLDGWLVANLPLLDRISLSVQRAPTGILAKSDIRSLQSSPS